LAWKMLRALKARTEKRSKQRGGVGSRGMGISRMKPVKGLIRKNRCRLRHNPRWGWKLTDDSSGKGVYHL